MQLTNPTSWCSFVLQVEVKKRALTTLLKKGVETGALVKTKDLYSLPVAVLVEYVESEQSTDKDAKKAAAAEKKAAAAAEKEAKKAAAAAAKEEKKKAAAEAKEEKKKAAAEKKAAAAAAKAAKKKEKE
jgi:hypothetical protein